MDTGRQQWLEHVIQASARAADAIAADDPYHRGLRDDILELRDRLTAELTDMELDA
jgi:hypothetical protein